MPNREGGYGGYKQDPRRSSGRSTMPSIESRSIAEGNSNAIPMSSTSDENIDMYERRVAVLVMSGLML